MILGFLRSLIGPLGQQQLPVFEMLHSTVMTKKLSNAPQWNTLTKKRKSLTFTGLQLAHAVVKADFLEYRNPILPGAGFLLQSHHVIDWSSPDFCLKKGGSSLLSDFTRTSMAGRIGQGITLLFANSLEYAFTAHLRQHLESIGVATTKKGKLLPVADFVCDGPNRALFESKASFSEKKNHPSTVKSDLKAALLKQVNPWKGKLNPAATKSYVVGTYMREKADPTCDPTSLVFVDPGEPMIDGELDLPIAMLRRLNYASWLSAMGISESAERLRSHQTDGQRSIAFLIFDVMGHRIAVTDFLCYDWPFHPQRAFAAGFELNALRAIQSAALGDDRQLLAYRPLLDIPGNGMGYSIFPDGTFLGSFNPSQIIERFEVRL